MYFILCTIDVVCGTLGDYSENFMMYTGFCMTSSFMWDFHVEFLGLAEVVESDTHGIYLPYYNVLLWMVRIGQSFRKYSKK